MRSLLSLCLIAASTIISTTIAGPIARGGSFVVVTPQVPSKAQVTKDNTLNGTLPDACDLSRIASNHSSPNVTHHRNGPHPTPTPTPIPIPTPSNCPYIIQVASLPIQLTNNYNGGQMYAYVTGLDPNGKVVMLSPNGQWYYPTSTSSTIPQQITDNVAIALGAQGQTTTFYLPTYVSSGRIYISEGQLKFSTLQTPNGVTLVQPDFNNPSDPSANINWSFIELTNIASGLFANLSFVDFVGLPLGMTLTTTDNGSTTVRGVNSTAVSTICSGLASYAGPDNAPWDQLCQYRSDGTPLRAAAPQKYIAVHGGAFQNYYTNYVNQVWSYYTSNTLTIDSQGSAGQFPCTVSGGTLNCNGGNRDFTQPGAADIFGCQGTFGGMAGDNSAVLPATARLCAAFNRATFLLDGGNVQPSLGTSSYYTVAPSNRYAQLVHQVELDGRGYAFPYDDVNPTGAPDQSGTLASGNAASLTITIGGA